MSRSRWVVSVVTAAVAVFFLSGFLSPSQGAPEKVAPQVEVVNFPLAQGVTGTVNVGNFPQVQEVEIGRGEVTVSNLPLDTGGNLKVVGNLTGCAGSVHFLGITQANLDFNIGVFEASRACSAEFQGSRVCEYFELMDSTPSPPTFPSPNAASVAFRITEPSSGVDFLDIRCVRGNGDVEFGGCASVNIYTLPVACCGH